MNQGIFRLVFDPRRGMRVPTAEGVRCRGKQTARGAGRTAAGLVAVLSAAVVNAAPPLPGILTRTPAASLPVPAANFNQVGRATQFIDPANGRRLVVQQADRKVVLNWTSFDIGSGYAVRFDQPDGGSALNRIGSASPSVILGNLEANGEVILYNANGVLFGRGATVNTGNFVATTLNIADSLFETGYRGITSGAAAFTAQDGEIDGFVRVEAGASISVREGGSLMLFAPRVLNEGTLSAPGGQVAMAAGQKVYLTSSRNAAERGLLVEVDPFATADHDYNTVENAAVAERVVENGRLAERVNQIVAERGSVSMVGLAVRQMGIARATTAVQGQNGAIYLMAHGRTTLTSLEGGRSGEYQAVADEMGTLTLGPRSVTRVDPDTSGRTQTDSSPFYNSIVRLEGEQIHLQGGAQIVAPGAGSVTPKDSNNPENKRGVSILASSAPRNSPLFVSGPTSGTADDSRVVIDPGVLIDVSGIDLSRALPMSRNVLSGRLFSIELADSPLQREGALYRAQISFDARKGTPVADVSGFYNAIERSAEELLTGGGSIAIEADGAVVVGQGAKLDVSGGSVKYAGGEVKTTLLRSGNRIIDISQARPDVIYDEVITPTRGRYEPGYVEGKDAGSLTVAARDVVLDADLAGKVTTGIHQRSTDTRPRGGSLQLGIAGLGSTLADFYLDSITLSEHGGAPLSADFYADPFGSSLGARGDSSALSALAVEAGGFSELSLLANGLLLASAGTSLDLGPAGSFSASAGRIDMGAAVRTPSGRIALAAVNTVTTGDSGISVVLRSGAELDASGTWTNDGLGRNRRATTAITTPTTDGGEISVSAYHAVELEQGSSLDVSAGAWRSNTGKLTLGDAGSITLATNVGNDPYAPVQWGTLRLAGNLAGYGFSGGGSLALTVPELTVANTDGNGFRLQPAFFSANGFQSISVRSVGDVVFADGVQVAASLRNWQFTRSMPTQASGELDARVVTATSLPAHAREAVDLSFAATRLPSPGLGYDGANLLIERGASIATEAGGNLTMSAAESMIVAGTLSAPGGKVNLTITGTRGGTDDNPDNIGLLPSQALWLTDTARILAGGTARIETDHRGIRTGTVFGGGSVNLDARRGYLVAESGALIDVSGFETMLNPYGWSALSLVSRGAGSVSLGGAEGIFFGAQMRAQAPSERSEGGSLLVSMSRRGLDSATSGAVMPYPDEERQIVVRAEGSSLPDSLAPGVDLDALMGNGVAEVSAAAINAAGFASVELRADDRIRFAESVNLSLSRSLQLNTRVIEGAGASRVTLQAPYVALGDRDITDVSGSTQASATGGGAALAVTADLVDVIGRVGLQGFAATELNATLGGRRDGEIRLRGRNQPNSTDLDGALLFAGELTLTAGQIYPTTLSSFAITGLAGDSVLRTRRPAGGSSSQAPLSALGSLSLSADVIEHGGVLRAPFGELALAADTLRLLDGSELSTSGAGLTVPVGTTVNGRSWFYYPTGQSEATPTGEILEITGMPVAKQVSIDAGVLDVSPGAKVSAAGGGDIQAAEFVAGVGGTQDYLSTPGLYAVLPGYSFPYAPYDTQASLGSDLRPGDQIVITMRGSGLAPGTYTLLPASYALLPGAYLVSLAKDQGKGPLKAAMRLTDDSVVVTGYRSAAGTAVRGDDYVRYLVEPASTFTGKAEYLLTSGNAFFSTQAARLGGDVGSRPADAGRISIVASQLMDWKAMFDLSSPSGARGGEFDLAVPNILVTVEGAGAPEGYTAVSAESLAATGAASVLLGGTRSGSGSSVSAHTVSENVRVAATGTPIRLNELMLAATDTVEVADGVAIVASGATSTRGGQLSLEGDGAFVRVSNTQGLDLVRTGVSRAAGEIVVGSGARLEGAEVQLDATARVALDDQAIIDAASFNLGTGRIALGGPSPEGDAVVLSGSLLNTVLSAQRLTLRSYSTIDFLGSLALGAVDGAGNPDLDFLMLDAQGLRGLGSASDQVRIVAGDVVLRNSTGVASTASGQGSLSIEARPPLRFGETGGLEIGAGAQSLGFGSARLASSGDIVFSGSGSLAAQGQLTLEAARVTAATGADQAATSAGVLTVARHAGGRSLNERVGIGAALALSGQRVIQDGFIDLAGGKLSIAASGTNDGADAVVLTAASQTRAEGYSATDGEGWTVYGDAGSIALSAQQGAIRVDGALSVAALAGGGNAGKLSFAATGDGGTLKLGDAATLSGSAGAAGDGGSLSADLRTLATPASGGNLDALAAKALAGGFDKAIDVRVREGDVSLANGSLKAESVAVAADAGSLTVNALIDAAAEQGGVVQLAAEGDVVLGPSGRIDARSTRAGANGGDVLLSSDSGFIRLQAGSAIDAGGDDAQDGRVVLRAARTANSVNVAPIAGSINAGTVAIEALKTYTGYTSLGTGTTAGAKLGQTTVMNDITSFMTSKNAILTALGVAADSRFHLLAGVDVRATGDFNIANDWNLYSASRPGGEPGFLTVRAGGNLNVNGTLSDGFNGVARNSTIQSGSAWSFRLAAGADLGAANPLAVTPNANAGDVVIAGGKLLRTTTGSIELAAGRDILLQGTRDNPATVMVTGAPAAALADFSPQAGAVFTSRGGRIAATAARDISSPASDQLINNWFFHSGRVDPNTGQFLSDLAWWSRFDLFRHGFGSFGGGNVALHAGRDVLNTSAFAPTSARMAADAPDASRLVVENGGDVDVSAGRDIAGGVYFVGRGDGSLTADGALIDGTSPANNVAAMAPVLAAIDADWNVRARGDIELAGIFNPTMFASTSSIANTTAASYFTYGAQASLDVATTAGNFVWSEPAAEGNSLATLATLPTGATADVAYLAAVDPYVLAVAPPSVSVSAFAGDLTLGVASYGLSLYPSADGNLSLYAGGDVELLGSVRVMDNLPGSLASVSNPVIHSPQGRGPSVELIKQTQTSIPTRIDFTTLHAGDDTPLRIHADGDIVVTDGQRIISPKAATITAGGDIVNLTYLGQHHDAGDETLIAAGGNVLGTQVVRQNGGLIMLAGPGVLKLEAGRQVDLGVSAGIETVANLYNPRLPDNGASVSISAGLAATLTDPGWAGFVKDYLAEAGSPSGADRRAELVAYVREGLALPGALSYDEARGLLEAAPEALRVAFVSQVLADEFGRRYLAPGKAYAAGWAQAAAAAGVSAADYSGRAFEAYRDQVVHAELWRAGSAGVSATGKAAKDAAYADGYKVLDVAGYGAPFSFFGDIDLVESKVQTKRGGDIAFRAPGGAINVGLSADASSSGSSRSAADRGVVAFSGGSIRAFSSDDFQVNSQKVFVMGTGNIEIWSSNGNIDSGRGANTTVTVPPLVPRITEDGVVFELPSLATGSGIGILTPASGEASGEIGLFAPRGEVIALDAMIRGPSIKIGAEAVRGADNIVGGSVEGAPAAPVAAPVAAPTSSSTASEATTASAAPSAADTKREVNSLLTVDVVGLGDGSTPAQEGEACNSAVENCAPGGDRKR